MTETRPALAPSVALVELGALTAALLLADRVAKGTDVRLEGVENTDAGTLCLKFFGETAAIAEVTDLAHAWAARLGTTAVVAIERSPRPESVALYAAPPVLSPLLGVYDGLTPKERNGSMKETFRAVGLLETQGLVANLHAVDAMLKAADVNLVGKEKIGGGYVTVFVGGELAAVQTAIEAGRRTVGELGGKLILADVISNPHPDLARLLPA